VADGWINAAAAAAKLLVQLSFVGRARGRWSGDVGNGDVEEEKSRGGGLKTTRGTVPLQECGF
jgi:hypothetical protein